ISKNKTTKTNINYEVGVIENNIDLSSIKKDEYQFYVAINFDENGNLTINDIKGVDIQNFEYYLNIALSDFLSDNYYNSEYYNVTMNPIKNMAFVYAVPNNLVFNDSISWGIRDAETYGYQVVGGVAVMIIAALVAIAALIFPIKRANEIPLFKWVSKIPFEVWIIIVSLTVAVLIVSSGYMIHPALNGQLDHFVGFNVEWFTASKKVIWALNFINWFVGFGVVFFATLIIKYIFNLGIKEYFKRRTILGKILMFFVTIIKRTLDEITKVDLRQKNNKLIIKLLLINAIILLIITSIWFFGIPVVILYSIVLFFVIRKYVDKISEKYSKLREATSKIAQGKLDVNIEEDLGLFEPFKEDLKEIQKGFKKAVDEEVKSQKMKTDLISNVSHDLKTPLTAIITYADLLKDENLSEEKRKQYIETLDKKAQRLQVLIEDLFEMSKATSGNITLNIENIDVVSLMKQTLLELEDKLEEANLSVRNNMPESKVVLPLDSQRTFRVFENLVINMTKYAMPNTRVFIDIIENEKYVEIIMKNMAAEEITFNVDTIAERFVRGDESRNTEGSGLGLAIAKSFV
ncbi:MAG: HAMP domain-containing sensor histidine kinase, partial [Clostridium celatum]|nr:HAMP domain-containing sensor histidine kinase [Clostridium celatum]